MTAKTLVKCGTSRQDIGNPTIVVLDQQEPQSLMQDTTP